MPIKAAAGRRDSPQVFCVLLFLSTASLFGTLISQINEIVNQKTSMDKELDEILESYLTVEPRRVVVRSLNAAIGLMLVISA